MRSWLAMALVLGGCVEWPNAPPSTGVYTARVSRRDLPLGTRRVTPCSDVTSLSSPHQSVTVTRFADDGGVGIPFAIAIDYSDTVNPSLYRLALGLRFFSEDGYDFSNEIVVHGPPESIYFDGSVDGAHGALEVERDVDSANCADLYHFDW